MCLAHVQEDEGGVPRLLHSVFHPCKADEQPRELTLLLKSLGLSGSCGRLVLDPTDYRVFQTSIPEVPAAEIREALRWRVQELLDFPADEAEIEFFPIPSAQQPGRVGMVNVVVCPKALVHSYSVLCEVAGLELEAIDIRELALRNLATRMPESARGLALLYLENNRGLLQLQKGPMVFISRTLDFGVDQIETALATAGHGQGDEMLDRLALEIQRSLDYYESHFGMPPVAGLVITPIGRDAQVLADHLNQMLGLINRIMDIAPLISCREPLDDITQQQCLPAIGGALRCSAAA